MTRQTILLVDDEAMLRMNMRAFLEDLGFLVQEAGGGPEALACCARQRPDLVLLDLNMPGMDGLEVCRRLKADPGTADFPVIFVSAFLATQDKVNAFSCGAVDYVTKPFHFQEVAARIGAHLELHRQRRLLQEQHAALASLERQRDAFTHMMAHDMRTPLTGLMGYVELASGLVPAELPELGHCLERAQSCASQLNGMITQMLDLSRLEAGSMPMTLAPCDLTSLALAAVEALRGTQGQRTLAVASGPAVIAWADQGLVERVLANLLGNACKFTPGRGHVTVQVSATATGALVTVRDDGPGIAHEHRELIFEKFGQIDQANRAMGFGLGLAFCKLAVTAQRGEIGVTSEPGQGSAFWFTLPARGLEDAHE